MNIYYDDIYHDYIRPFIHTNKNTNDTWGISDDALSHVVTANTNENIEPATFIISDESCDDLSSVDHHVVTAGTNNNLERATFIISDESSDDLASVDHDLSFKTTDGIESVSSNAIITADSIPDVVLQIRDQWAKHLLMPCCPPPDYALPFESDEVFKSVFDGEHDLMRALLSSYTPMKEISNSQVLIQLLGDRHEKYNYVFHGKKFENLDPSKPFFEIFNHLHFKIRYDSTVKYGFLVYPTTLLMTIRQCSIFDDAIDELVSFQKNVINKAKCAWDETRFSRVFEDNLPLTYVLSCFKKTWVLQSDGDPTNATLTGASIKLLVQSLFDLGVFSENDIFLDLGSSYGSLLWAVIQEVTRLNPSCQIQGMGWEISEYRCFLGSHAVLKMIQGHKNADRGRLVNLNVHFFKKDIYQHKGLGNATIAFAFDKVFEPRLVIKIVFECIRSPAIKYFINTKGSWSSLIGPVPFKAHEFIMSTGCFMLVGLVKGCKMAKESAGNFHVYRKISSKVPSLDTILPGIPHKFITKIQNDLEKGSYWNEVEENFNPDPFDNEHVNNIMLFYKNLGSLETLSDPTRKLLEKQLYRCGNIEELRCNTSVQCLDCLMKYPSDRDSPCETQKSTIHNCGLFARQNIRKGTYLCQYMGKFVPPDTKGDYVVAVDQYMHIDAKRSKCIARYVNHSCAPNSILQVIMVEEPDESTFKKKGKECGGKEVWVRAMKDIKEGEEITIHYGDEYLQFFPDGMCNCEQCAMQIGKKCKRKRV
jgi:hypothetical protein